MSLTYLRWGILAGATLISLSAQAWWDLGHSAICTASLNKVSAETRREVERLLAISDEAAKLQPETFGQACTWADRIKRARPETSPWHYFNVPLDVDSVANASHPPEGDILGALAAQSALLADKSATDAERAEALRWIGHFVGDLHQPMHLGLAEDWGGNKVRLAFGKGVRERVSEPERARTNLHAAWDGLLLINAMGNAQRSLVDLMSDYPGRTDGAADDWANESLNIARQPTTGYVGESRVQTLDVEYLNEHSSVAIRRLADASARLATLLEALLKD